MKIPAALVASLAVALFAAAQTSTQSTSSSGTRTRIVLPEEKPATKPGDKAAPGKTEETAKKEEGKATPKSAKKEEPKIEGMEIPRGGERGFLGLQIVNSTFKLSFYDKAKKPVTADVARAALRWDPKYKVGDDRVVLNPSEDGKSLTSARNIRPPYNFKLFITLLKSAAEGAEPTVSESYVVDFKG